MATLLLGIVAAAALLTALGVWEIRRIVLAWSERQLILSQQIRNITSRLEDRQMFAESRLQEYREPDLDR